jgi:signal peptidase I
MSQPVGEVPETSRRDLRRQSRREPEISSTRRRWAFLREWAAIALAVILMSLLVKTFLLQAFFIPSASMEPTLHGCPRCAGDRVVVNKLTSHMGGVHRGDIVVFRDSAGWLAHPSATPGLRSVHDVLAFIGLVPSSNESDLVKRVIGVGGDTVEGRDGKVYVNGTQLDEPYVFGGDRPTEITFEVRVPAGRLWVMGDHRSDSSDSRFHQEEPGKGFVAVNDVIGRAFVIIWPLDRAGSLDRPAMFDQPGLTARR